MEIGTSVTPTQTFSPLVCSECCNAKTARQKFCKKCTTRHRVAKHREQTAPLRKMKASIQRVHDNHTARKRGAIANCSPLTERNELKAGLDSAVLRERTVRLKIATEEKERCKRDCKNLRAETKKQRDALKRQNKALTLELKQRIAQRVAECDAFIRIQN